jgi:membrane protease YdiL (CAAX protease family)
MQSDHHDGHAAEYDAQVHSVDCRVADKLSGLCYEFIRPGQRLVALALAIGFFEAIFWRGWVLLRLEEAFGIIPAILVGLVLCAAYHIGYGMAASKMIALFFVGVMFAMVFRLTNNVFILWPIFQPMGQLVTLIRDGLTLPPMAALGVIEVLILMFVFVWLAARRQRKHSMAVSAA